MKFKWLFIFLIELFFIIKIKTVHINKDLQNLSIESSGELDNNNDNKASNKNITEDTITNNNITDNNNNNNNTYNSNNTDTDTLNKTDINNINSENNTNNEESNTEIKGFDTLIDWKNISFKDGIIYNSETGLPILPKLNDGFLKEYNFDDVPQMKEALSIEIGWIIIGICITLLVIMIITIIIVSVTRHRRNRRRREEHYE